MLSDRHFGVGSDGLIMLCKPKSSDGAADIRMRMFNADGSEGEMCGNGIRCAVKFGVEKGICSRGTIVRVETMGGVIREVECMRDGDDIREIKVDMGRPIMEQ